MFEDYRTDNRYDVVSAFEVFEHFRNPLFCLGKVYDLLAPGGHFMMTIPEEHGRFGLSDNNRFHYWTATIQSMVSVCFHDEHKWWIKEIFEKDGLVHILAKKL